MAQLKDASAESCAVGDSGLVLAATKEFSGQGLWRGNGGAVAYDLDLTNETQLRRRAGLGLEEPINPGALIWTLYRNLGTPFLDRLRGPFAFALWDESDQKLIVATDPYGIRPVVYARTPGGLVAASRIRQVLLHPAVERELDLEAAHQYLFFSAIPSPITIYRAIQKLEPGKFLIHSRDATSTRTHYDIAYRPDQSAGESFWTRAIPLEVRRAVQRFLPLSEPGHTGCFLSGGTDSSSVVGYYTGLSGRPAKTFSIGFDEPGYNELDFAHTAARHFGTEQHDYVVTPEDVLTLVEELPRFYDEPFGNASVVPAYYCAKLAKEAAVEVLLAGDGGDEIFGGNERYVGNLLFQRYHAIPSVMRQSLLEPILSRLPELGPVHKARRYIRRANIPNPDRFYSYNLLAETDQAEVFQQDFLQNVDQNGFLRLARKHYACAAPAHDTDRLLYLDMKFTITDNDLRKVTQMAEATGVRARYPLLDRDLVDFTATIPPAFKVKPGRGRYIFKRAMEGFLPREIIEKAKHGFGLPVAPWFKKHRGLAALLNDTLFAPGARVTEWVRPEFLQTMKASFEQDTTSYYGLNLWTFLMLELWMRNHGGHGEHGG